MTLAEFNPNWNTATAAVTGDGRKSVVKVDVIHPKFTRADENVLVEIAEEGVPNPFLTYGMPEGLIWVCLEQLV